MVGIILGAGYARRMGKDKLLLPFKETTIIETIIKEGVASELERIYLVCRDNQVKEIAKKYPIHVIINENAGEGQSTSIVKAMEAVGDIVPSYIFLMGDQPLISKDFINSMMDFYRQNHASILVPVYNGKPGTPTIFSNRWQEHLLKLKGDEGGRSIIRAHPKEVQLYPVENGILGKDVDSLEQYIEILNL